MRIEILDVVPDGDDQRVTVSVVEGSPSITHDGEHTTVRAIAEVDLAGFVLRLPWRDLTLWPTGIDHPLR